MAPLGWFSMCMRLSVSLVLWLLHWAPKNGRLDLVQVIRDLDQSAVIVSRLASLSSVFVASLLLFLHKRRIISCFYV